MAQHDPFTLDLFGNTSLSSGLGLGVTAFPSTFETDGDDGDPPHPPAVALREPPIDRPTSRAKAENFYLAGARGLAKSWRDRARDNLAAIRLAAVIEGDQRSATADEQAQLHTKLLDLNGKRITLSAEWDGRVEKLYALLGNSEPANRSAAEANLRDADGALNAIRAEGWRFFSTGEAGQKQKLVRAATMLSA